MLALVFAAAMLVPLGVAWWTDDAGLPAFPPAMGATFVCGLACGLPGAGTGASCSPATASCWCRSPGPCCRCSPRCRCCLHFRAAGTPMGFTDAYFEAVSGLTTTGATVLVGLDALPLSVNVWRCFLQWIGGMGILVLAVAILPMLGVGGSQLFRAEMSGPMKDTKLTPRITETAKGLWSVYVAASLRACWPTGRAGCRRWTPGCTCSPP